MSWRDGLEMRSAINTTASSLHYLHLYKFWRCFGGYDYLSGSAREANSASSLCRYLHRRHHLQLFQQFRQKITSTRTLLNFLWYVRPRMSLSSPPFNHIYYFLTLISSFLSKSASFWWANYTHSLKLPYLPHIFYSRFYFLVTLVYVFCVLHAYSCPVLSSYMLWFASLPSCHRFEIVRRQHTNKSFW